MKEIKKNKNGAFVAFTGEAANHHHAVNNPAEGTKMYQKDNGNMLLKVDEKEKVETFNHEEHGAIELDSGRFGDFTISRQTEYLSETERRVVAD